MTVLGLLLEAQGYERCNEEESQGGCPLSVCGLDDYTGAGPLLSWTLVRETPVSLPAVVAVCRAFTRTPYQRLMSLTALSQNGLSQNGLSQNGLSQNGYGRYPIG